MVIDDLFLSVIFLAFISLSTDVVLIITILILTFYRRRHRHHASDVVVVVDTDLPSFFSQAFPPSCCSSEAIHLFRLSSFDTPTKSN